MSQALLQRLWELQARPRLFGGQKRDAEVVRIIEQLAATGEPRPVLTMVPYFLVDAVPEVRMAAARALHQIFSCQRPDQLFDLSSRVEASSAPGWGASVAWRDFQPSSLPSLATDEPTRVSILGYASFHHNGYVRHEAVHLLARIHDGQELPFLLIRQNDWVAQVSSAAQAVVRERLKNEYLRHFVANLSLVVHLLALSRRDHSQVVRRIVELLLQPEHDALLAEALRSPNRKARRDVVSIALGLDGEHQRRVVEHGLLSDDSAIRLWCSRRVRPCASGEALRAILLKLRHDPFMPVRREAVLIESGAFPESAIDVWKAGLLDSSSSLRDLSQFHLAKLGNFRPADFYRQMLADNPNLLPALSGLGEAGDQSDLPEIRKHLAAPLSHQRAAAVRGISRIGGEAVVSELIELLADDSTAVVRTVRNLLEKSPHLLDGERLIGLASNDHRSHVRRAALWLLFEKGKWDGLKWLIRAARHIDPETADLSQELIEKWFSPPLCNKIFTKPTESQRQAIVEAFVQAKEVLDPSFRKTLGRWLDEI